MELPALELLAAGHGYVVWRLWWMGRGGTRTRKGRALLTCWVLPSAQFAGLLQACDAHAYNIHTQTSPVARFYGVLM